MPAAADGSKQGVDDLVASRGSAAAFEELVKDAEPWGSRGMVHKLQVRVRELEQIVSAQASVLRNTELTPAQKIVTIATVNEAGWRESAGGPAPYKVNATRIAQAAGVSPQTASSAIKALSADNGLFEKRIRREYSDELGWRSTMQLTPRHDGGVIGLLKATATYTPPRPEGKDTWGGKRTPRPQCPDHPLADVLERRSLACSECGQVLGEPEVKVLKCQDDHSDTAIAVDDPPRTQVLEASSPAHTVRFVVQDGVRQPVLVDYPSALNDQVDSSDGNAPLPGLSVQDERSGPREVPAPSLVLNSDQVDSSERADPPRCSECRHRLFPDEWRARVCGECASRLVPW